MLKRFWLLLTVVTIVVLAAIIIPAAATLMPKLSDKLYLYRIYWTSISLSTSLTSFPDGVKEGEPFEVSGYLYYKDLGYFSKRLTDDLEHIGEKSLDPPLPLSFRTVILQIPGTNFYQELLTDSDGYFHATVQINNKSRWAGYIQVGYRGEEYSDPYSDPPLTTAYLFCMKAIPEGKYTIPGQGGPIKLSSVITMGSVLFAILFFAIIAYFIYHYRKKLRAWLKRRKVKAIAPEMASMETLLVSTEAAREVSTGDPRVEILFPLIENSLPPVWGIGEPLTITSRVLIETSENNANAIPAIKTTDSAIDIVAPDFSPVKIEHSFDRKGETDINVYFGGDTGDKMFNTRKIKIVDYREEIVELFNRLIDALSAEGIEVDRKMTAREIESQLKEKYPDLSPDTMKDIVKGFEYANYSLHPVARKIYVDMYLAVGKIRERVKNA